MAARKIIRVGDPTSHGGIVITGSASHTIGGKAIARKGDKVDCPEKYPDGSPHGVNEIIEGEERMHIEGIPVALEGMRTACGCTLIGTGNATYGGDDEPTPVAARASRSAPAGNMVKTAAAAPATPNRAALSPVGAAPVAMRQRYVLTIYAAAPGTPLAIDGGTSLPGHMYYTISDFKSPTKSYGFAPVDHGAVMGAGRIPPNDLQNYQSPRYARTIEISSSQYQSLLDFGSAPEKFRFSKYYEHAKNNCVDFVWNALRHADLVATTNYAKAMDWGAKRQYEGELKPNDNMEAIRSIKAPFPSSELNTERINPMPNRSLLQRLLSEGQRNQRPDTGRG